MKDSGKPDDRKGHVRFDAAGAGNGFTVRLVRHRQTKEADQIGFTYETPRQSSTLHYNLPECFLTSRLRCGRKSRCHPCAAMIATVGGGTSGARSPRKSAFGKVGACTEDMKDKRAQAKPAKHQRFDRYYEEPLEDKGGHPPTQSERNPNR